MTGLKLAEETCRVFRLDKELCTPFLIEILKIGGKDLRSAPFIKLILESMIGKTRDQISRALETTKEKYAGMGDKEFLSPKYFIAVLKNTPVNKQDSYDDNQNLNWGKSI